MLYHTVLITVARHVAHHGILEDYLVVLHYFYFARRRTAVAVSHGHYIRACRPIFNKSILGISVVIDNSAWRDGQLRVVIILDATACNLYRNRSFARAVAYRIGVRRQIKTQRTHYAIQITDSGILLERSAVSIFHSHAVSSYSIAFEHQERVASEVFLHQNVVHIHIERLITILDHHVDDARSIAVARHIVNTHVDIKRTIVAYHDGIYIRLTAIVVRHLQIISTSAKIRNHILQVSRSRYIGRETLIITPLYHLVRLRATRYLVYLYAAIVLANHRYIGSRVAHFHLRGRTYCHFEGLLTAIRIKYGHEVVACCQSVYSRGSTVNIFYRCRRALTHIISIRLRTTAHCQCNLTILSTEALHVAYHCRCLERLCRTIYLEVLSVGTSVAAIGNNHFVGACCQTSLVAERGVLHKTVARACPRVEVRARTALHCHAYRTVLVFVAAHVARHTVYNERIGLANGDGLFQFTACSIYIKMTCINNSHIVIVLAQITACIEVSCSITTINIIPIIYIVARAARYTQRNATRVAAQAYRIARAISHRQRLHEGHRTRLGAVPCTTRRHDTRSHRVVAAHQSRLRQ